MHNCAKRLWRGSPLRSCAARRVANEDPSPFAANAGYTISRVVIPEFMDHRAVAQLAAVHDVLLTPHISGVGAESNQRVSFLIAGKVLEALR